MIAKVLSRALAATGDVTTDLYLRNSCADLIGEGIRQEAPTVFTSASTCLVIRHGPPPSRLPARRRLVYLIDDDIPGGIADRSLPWLYRSKLRLLEGAFMEVARPVAETVVVASEGVAAQFAESAIRILRPFWSEPFADLTHFDAPGSLDLAFLGSGVHRADLAFLAPALRTLLTRYPFLRVHIPSEHSLSRALAVHPRVQIIHGRSWPDWRREIARQRFHLAVYPLSPGPFNHARSPNKLIEHAIVGAAPIYTSDWAWGRRAAQEGAGSIAGPVEEWIETISRLIEDPTRMRTLARGAQRMARSLNRPEPQRRLWKELFELSGAVPP